MLSVVPLFLLPTAVLASHHAAPSKLLVSAANSLSQVLNDIGKDFQSHRAGIDFRPNYAASGVLLRQIEQGAPVDVFVSASPKEINELEKAGKVEDGTRVDFAGNRLLLIVPRGGRVKGWDDLRQPWVHHIAIGNPDLVPVGRYAKETLQRRGLWDAVQKKCVLGENAQATFTYVSGGNVDAGIVFATDMKRLHGGNREVAADAVNDHTPIVYTACVVKGTDAEKRAREFVQYLLSPAAAKILKNEGFTPAPGSTNNPSHSIKH